MYRLQYDADVEKHPTGLGRLSGPPLFPPPEIARLLMLCSRGLTHLCVLCAYSLLHDGLPAAFGGTRRVTASPEVCKT